MYYVVFLLNSRSSTVEKDRCIVDVGIGAERNISYTCGMKVAQWTVSNAPDGSSLRDVNTKAKVKSRA